MSETGIAPEITETKQKKLIVEIGHGATPYFAIGSRPIDADAEIYTGVEISDSNVQRLYKDFRELRPQADALGSIEGSAFNLLFGDGTVDEIICTNLFGDPGFVRVASWQTADYAEGKAIIASGMHACLAEFSRVLKKGGKVIITETITPKISREDLGLLGRNAAEMNRLPFFEENGLAVEKFSTDRQEIGAYDESIEDTDESIKIKHSFTLVLKKI